MAEWKFTPERQKYHAIAQRAAWAVNKRMRSGQTPTQFANRSEYVAIKLREAKRKANAVKSAFRKGEISESTRDSQLRKLNQRESEFKQRLKEMKAQQKTQKKKRGTK